MTEPVTGDDLEGMTDKQLVAGRRLYDLALPAAKQRRTLSYAEAADETGYAPVGIGRALDALAAYCEKQKVPDLSSLYRPKNPGRPGRWTSDEEREEEADRCYAHRRWPKLKP